MADFSDINNMMIAMQRSRMGGDADPAACEIGASSPLFAVLPNLGNATAGLRAFTSQPIALCNGAGFDDKIMKWSSRPGGLDLFGLFGKGGLDRALVRDLPANMTDGIGGSPYGAGGDIGGGLIQEASLGEPLAPGPTPGGASVGASAVMEV